MRHCALRGHEVVVIYDMRAGGFDRKMLLKWADEMSRINCVVARGYPGPGLEVCTDFLGVAINWEGEPQVFETAIFVRSSDDEPGLDGRGKCEIIGRCATWEQAEQMHAAAMKACQKATRS